MEREMRMQSLHEPLIRRWQLSIIYVDYGLVDASDLQCVRTNVVDADSSPVIRHNDGRGACGRVL